MSTDSKLRSARDAKGREVGEETETETETETEAEKEIKRRQQQNWNCAKCLHDCQINHKKQR